MDQGMQSQLGAMEVESLQAMVKQTEAKLQELSVEHDRMIAEGKEQQQAFIRREVQYQSQIKRMKELLEKAISSRGNENNGMPRLREMHEKIMQKLAEKQDATKTLMMKQEKEMLKIFRSKLFEVEDKLKKTGGKKNNEAVGGIPRSWLERATKLARELEHYKEESIRLDAENERLTKESTRLQAEYHSHEDDVRYLESQLVALKKENLKLKKDREDAATVSMRAFLATDHSKRQRSQEEERPPAEDGSKPQESKQMEEEAYAQIEKVKVSISRMRKLIEDERARLREVRTAHVKELASRTELESDHASPPLFSFLTFSSPPQVSFVTVLPMSRSRLEESCTVRSFLPLFRSQDTRWSPWTKSHRRSTTPLAPCMRRRTRKRSGTGFWSCSCPRRGLSPFCLRRPFLIKHQ
mmetsp:Transcript_3448/g.11909  ORF Transcript_3448/g.11909 Transcript_3448/m.11909 type:complete len:411 (+) Transcript_3448:508-1740(+)